MKSRLQSPTAVIPLRTLPEYAVFVEAPMDMTHDSHRSREVQQAFGFGSILKFVSGTQVGAQSFSKVL